MKRVNSNCFRHPWHGEFLSSVLLQSFPSAFDSTAPLDGIPASMGWGQLDDPREMPPPTDLLSRPRSARSLADEATLITSRSSTTPNDGIRRLGTSVL